MMLVEVRPIPIKLWLAAEPPQDDDRPEQQGRSVAADSSALRVLIVEDEFYIALDIQASLNALGHSSVGIAVSFDQAVTIAGRERPDIVLMDIRIAGSRDGVEAAEEIFSRFGIRSVFVTANTDPYTRRRADAVNPVGFLEKPINSERLRNALDRLREQS
jgi:two-component system, response regulator PdtaR